MTTDAPEAGRTALENVLSRLASDASRKPPPSVESADDTVHDMRFVFLDNDTRMLFATAYDGDWDAYIDDFATKIPDFLDIIDSAWEGWPGIRSPEAKDYLAKHQVTAEGWYVASPDLTVVETRKLKRRGHALDDFLDKVGG